jgi:hypothetical protein
LEHLNHSSGKKSLKKKKGQLVHRYLNNTITSKQLGTLTACIQIIQRCWRGFLSRRQFATKLSDESTKYRYIKNTLENKKDVFWNSEEDNSIVNLEKDSSIKVY